MDDEHPLHAVLKPLFEELASSNAAVMRGAVAKLANLVEEEGDSLLHRTNAINSQTKFLPKFLESQLQALVNKPEQRLGAVLAIETLRNVEFVDAPSRLTLFHQLLLKVVCDPSLPSREASRVWGLLMDDPSGTASDLVESQLHRCLESLTAESLTPNRKFVGALLLQEVALRVTSTLLIGKFEELTRALWNALKEPQDYTRQAASVALRRCLDVVMHSADLATAEVWYDNLLMAAARNISAKPREVIHGGFLGFHAFLEASVQSLRSAAQVLHASRIREVYLLVVQNLQKPSPHAEIRAECVLCIPLMAQLDKKLFVELCLTEFVVWAGKCYRDLNGPDERGGMFLSIGKLATVLQDKVPVFMDRVMAFIEGSLVKRAKRDRCPEAVTCFALIATADPKTSRAYLRVVMPLLFLCVPSVEFAKDIASICSSFPELRSTCMERLLDATRGQLQQVKPRTNLTSAAAGDADTRTTLNALQVLLTVPFEGYSTLTFLTEWILRFLQDPHEDVRRAAVALSLKLVHSGCSAPGSPCIKDAHGALVHRGRQHVNLVMQVVKALITSAVADPESDIRLTTLQQLTEEYDDSLALQECVRALFPALNDKHQNRIAALQILGRLGRRNRASVFPMMRRMLLQCLMEIQHCSGTKKQEQTTWVLSAVIEAAPALIRPYSAALFESTVERLRDKTLPPTVQAAILSCIGKLVGFTDEVDLALVRDVRSMVVSHILDSSYPPKKQEGIRALGELVRATRDITVYERHPELLHVLLSALYGGFKETWPVRHDVLRLLGIVGAVDPVKLKGISRTDARSNLPSLSWGASTGGGPGESGGSRMRPEEEKTAVWTTTRAILDVIELPSSHDEQCVQAIQALVNIFTARELPLQSMVGFFNRAIPAILRHVDGQKKLRDRLFRHLASLVSVAKHHIRVHLDEILESVRKYLPGDDPELLVQILLLLVELRRSLNEEFRPHLRVLLPLFVQAAQNDPTANAPRVFECLAAFGKLMEGHLHLVLPCVVELGSSMAVPHATRIAAVACITTFAKQLTSLADHAARCIHCLCRILQEPLRPTASSAEKDEREQLAHAALTALLTVAQNLGPGFQKFVALVRPTVLQRFGGENSQRCITFQCVTDEVIRSRSRIIAPEPPRPVEERVVAPNMQARRRDDSSANRFAVVRNILLPVERSGEEEWMHWLRMLAIELLRCSPCPAHGFALPLATIHEPFARQLFHSAFAACFAEMDENVRQEVIALLTGVLRSTKLPSEVLQELLNLSEYMERCDAAGSIAPSPVRLKSYGVAGGGLFDLGTLIERSDKCSLHAKALHYLEVQFYELTREYEKNLQRGRIVPVSEENWKALLSCAERSIQLCNMLGQRESANGILKFIQDNYSRLTGLSTAIGVVAPRTAGRNAATGGSVAGGAATTSPPPNADGSGASNFALLDAELLEKLQWWSQSLKAYQERLMADPNNTTNMRGVLVAYEAQGEYTKLLDAYKTFCRRIPKKEASLLAPMGAKAAWILQSWEDMEGITQVIASEGYQGITALFYNAVIAVHKRDFRRAQHFIFRCVKDLDAEIGALVAESYDRAYELLIGNQQLIELEEIMAALREPSSIHHWKELWERRLRNMAFEGWQGTLALHSLILPYDQELGNWLQFVSLCRINGRERVSHEVLTKILGGKRIAEIVRTGQLDDQPKPQVALAALTHMYEVGKREQALSLLQTYIDNMEPRALSSYAAAVASTGGGGNSSSGGGGGGTAVGVGGSVSETHSEFAACRARLGEWLATQHATDMCFNRSVTDQVLSHLQRATELDPDNGNAWHTWAKIHHDVAVKLKDRFNTLEKHVSCALDGYLRSISIHSRLQDVLGFLSLWFAYGTCCSAVERGDVLKSLLQINTDVWLSVIPQIMARIYTPNPVLNDQVYTLLSHIAKTHPQALLYTLNVSGSVGTAVDVGLDGNAPNEPRRIAAQRVFARITELHHNGTQLVQEATMVCTELVRCAVLWPELWYDQLDRAWAIWGKQKDPNAVLQCLTPLINLMAKPETMAEHHFIQEFGQHLEGAISLIRDAANASSHKTRDMDEAWSLFKNIVERIDQQVSAMTSLALQLVSPKLLQHGRNLLLAVPGQYREVGEYPRISSFHGTLRVMASKQHPRRFSLYGSDGNTYKFLLKGHEDLRLDERVMQLLGLVNTLLQMNSSTNARDCFVQTYSVTPLNENAGMVGWVDHCDTLHQIIKDHRAHGKLAAEINIMRAFAEDLSRLTIIQHVEPFEQALEGTEGNDLARSLWIRAPSAETWLQRRTTYVRTLATMSMVGHVLGLGDRHPSNMMIHSFSGRVIHIDFGDCFEVAQQRTQFPEKVPFRLTRMFIKAMEIGGIEGLFRHGCVGVMSVLRDERDSLLAMLEAFLHDPLISWFRDDDDEGGEPAADGAAAEKKSTDGSAAAVGGGGPLGQSLQRSAPRAVDVNVVGSFSAMERSVRRRAVSSIRRTVQVDKQHTQKAQKVLHRIQEKLHGKEFAAEDIRRDPATALRDGLVVEAQVTRLIQEATSNENLCQHFPGWCPFW